MPNFNNIVTVTFNPAIDMLAHIPALQLGEVNRIESSTIHPAGKGINVATCLSILGHEVTVTGFLGMDNISLFKAYFKQHKFNDQFVSVQGATRTNIKMTENFKTTTDFNFPSFSVSSENINSLATRLKNSTNPAAYCVLAGSLPIGFNPSQLAQMITSLNSSGNKVILDTSGDAFKQAIKAKPWLVKPNLTELETYATRPLNTFDEIIQAGQDIFNQGIKHVVISLGEAGAIWMNAEGIWHSRAPKIQRVISTTGAGDTLVAGIVHGLIQGWSIDDILRFAVSLASFKASHYAFDIQSFKIDENIDVVKI